MRERISRLDLVTGVLLAVLGTAEAAWGLTGPAEAWYVVATVPLATLPVVVRRAAPSVALALVLVTLTLQAAVGAQAPGGLAEGIALVLVVYSTASNSSLRTALVYLAVALVGQAVVIVVSGEARPGNFVYAATVVVAAWLAGRGTRIATERSELLAERRVAQERARIARELHDVVSHHVSAIVVQAAAEGRALPPGSDTARLLGDVERRGRETLNELRRLLGVLRLDDEGGAPLAPQPGLADLPRLVDAMADQGLDVTWSSSGDAVPVGEGLELAIYRVVQESLTNAGRHAGEPRADVALRWRPEHVEVEVLTLGEAAHPRHVPGSGFGLRAMADRIQAYGGELTARRTTEGFRVHALFPVEGR